jgi:WXG100 family type VII secretion target
MSEIKISFEGLRALTDDIRGVNASLTQNLQDIKAAINQLESQWSSDASDTIRLKANKMEPKFEHFYNVIESYAKFLDSAVSEYTVTETAIYNNAERFL